jgi:hypothetical protein
MAARVRAEGTAFLKESRLYPAASSRLPADARAQLVHDFEQLSPDGVAGTAESLVARVNVFERLPQLDVPTLIVVGLRDPDFVQNAPRLVAQLRRNIVQMVNLDDAGHAANLEKPEEFNAALVQFAEDLGYLRTDGMKRSRRAAIVMIGGSFVTAGLALLAAAIIIGQDNESAGANGSPPTATERPSPAAQLSPSPEVSPSPAVSETVAGATTAPTGQPTATATSTPPPEDDEPAPTQPVVEPPDDPEPTEGPPPTDTPTTEPTPTATASPSGPSVTLSGPSVADAGGTASFTATATGDPSVIVINVSGPGGAETIGRATASGSVSGTASFGAAGCYVVTATAIYGSDFEEDRILVAVGGATC